MRFHGAHHEHESQEHQRGKKRQTHQCPRQNQRKSSKNAMAKMLEPISTARQRGGA
jgi:hypothetical protein